MDWWGDGTILAGRDGQAGGTWLGVNKGGKFAAITNHKEEALDREYKLSRGKLITDFLQGDTLSAKDYLRSLQGDNFAGFNILVSDSEGVHSFSNRREGITTLTEGVHALGNRFLNSNTEKVIRIKSDFTDYQQSSKNKDYAFEIMTQNSGSLEAKTQQELKKRDYEEIPYRFIKSNFYGTRCTTYLSIDSSGEINVSEQNYSEGGEAGQRKDFEFVVS
jgi:uncharacterized protein with NRDE domain